jgi:hypothetical protein
MFCLLCGKRRGGIMKKITQSFENPLEKHYKKKLVFTI